MRLLSVLVLVLVGCGQEAFKPRPLIGFTDLSGSASAFPSLAARSLRKEVPPALGHYRLTHIRSYVESQSGNKTLFVHSLTVPGQIQKKDYIHATTFFSSNNPGAFVHRFCVADSFTSIPNSKSLVFGQSHWYTRTVERQKNPTWEYEETDSKCVDFTFQTNARDHKVLLTGETKSGASLWEEKTYRFELEYSRD